jgi:tetratricopeptide (TPR) repeat protein
MGYDDNADVATLLGHAGRKLGRYDDAKYWYDKALAADPNHALTWSSTARFKGGERRGKRTGRRVGVREVYGRPRKPPCLENRGF